MNLYSIGFYEVGLEALQTLANALRSGIDLKVLNISVEEDLFINLANLFEEEAGSVTVKFCTLY